MQFSIAMHNALCLHCNALCYWIHSRILDPLLLNSLFLTLHCSLHLAELLCFAPSSAHLSLHVSLTPPQMFTSTLYHLPTQTFGRRQVLELGQHVWWTGTWQPLPFICLQICPFISFAPLLKQKHHLAPFSSLILKIQEVIAIYRNIYLPNNLTIQLYLPNNLRIQYMRYRSFLKVDWPPLQSSPSWWQAKKYCTGGIRWVCRKGDTMRVDPFVFVFVFVFVFGKDESAEKAIQWE